MIGEDAREKLAHQLQELDVRELVDVLRRVLPAYTETANGLRNVLVLAQATVWDTDTPDGTQDTSTDLSTVVWPDAGYYGDHLGPDQGLWEEGSCRSCDLAVVSNAKRAHCPVCGTACYLT
ncbi:hypothetical protein [Rugosimonospora africana]|uniref:hypothetical protein n=1 Tax=Rugosimonospora africana TaxID=556532 RepID=UPI0019449BF0|nr:hypothetical protein [Rugosimonospora africana]